MDLETVLAALIIAVSSGVAGYVICQQLSPGKAERSSLTDIEREVLRMVAGLVQEWNLHKKKRSGTVDGPDELEFVLTVRPRASTTTTVVNNNVATPDQL